MGQCVTLERVKHNHWSTALVGTATGTVPITGDTVIFGVTPTTISTTTPRAINLNTLLGANFSLASLQFNSASGFGPTTVDIGVAAGTTRTLTLGAGGITLNSGAGRASILNGANVTLGAAQSWTNNSSNTLSVFSSVNLGGFTLTSSGSGSSTFFGVLSNGALTQSGTGTLTLSGVNSYTGNTTVNAGTLAIAAGGSIASTSALSVGAGTFSVAFTGTGNTQTVNGLTLSGGPAQMTNSTASNTLALGTITRTGVATVNFTITGNITTTNSNSNSILGAWATVGGNDWASKDGSNNIVAGPQGGYTTQNAIGSWSSGNHITNSAAFTGTYDTPVSIGTLCFAATAASTVNSGGTNNITVTYANGGTLFTLTTGNTSGLAVGQLVSGNSNIPTGAYITAINSSTTFTISAATTGVATAQLRNVSGQLNLSDGGILVSSAVGSNASAIGTTGTITTSSTALYIYQNNVLNGLTISNKITNGPNSAFDLVKTGPGTLILSSTLNDFGGVSKSIYINGGVLAVNVNNNAVFGDTNNVIVLNGGSLQNFTTTATISRNITVNDVAGNGLAGTSANPTFSGLISGAGNLTLTGNSSLAITNVNNSFGSTNKTLTLSMGGGATAAFASGALGTNTVTVNFTGNSVLHASSSFSTGVALNLNSLTSAQGVSAGAGQTLTLTGAITGASTQTLNINGGAVFTAAGTTSIVNLNGDMSNYSGGITLSAGTVKFGASAPLPTAGFAGIVVGGTSGVFDINGNSITSSALSSNSATAQVQNSGSAATITNSGAATFNGSVSAVGTINVVKNGTGVWTFNAANPFTGTTVVNGGTLSLATAGQFTATSSVTVRSGGILIFNSTASAASGGALVDTIPVTLGGANFGGGTLTTTLSEAIGSLSVDVGANTITVPDTKVLTLSNLLTRTVPGGTINFAFTGTGTVAVTGAISNTSGILGPWATVTLGTNADFATKNLSTNVAALGAATTSSDTAGGSGSGGAWAAADNINVGTVFNFTGSRSINTLRNTSAGGTLGLGASQTLTTNAILQNGSASTLQITGSGTSSIIAPNNEFFVHGNVAFGVSIAVPLTGSGGTASTILTVNVSNSLTLSNANNKISDIYINGTSTLISSAANGLGNATSGTINLTGTGILNLTAVQSYNTANSNAKTINVSGNPKITANTTNSTDVITFDNANVKLNDNSQLTLGAYGNSSSKGTIALNNSGGKITGNGSLLFGGSSGSFGTIFSVYGTNDYTGTTSFGNGNSGSGGYRVNFNTSSAFGTGTIFLLAGNGGLALESLQALSANLTIPNPIRSQVSTVNSFFNLGGSSTNDFTLSGPISLESAQLLGFSVASGRTITLSGNISEVFGSRPITVVGPGSLALSGASTYTGVTTIRSGAILVGGNAPSGLPGALGNATSAVVLGDASTVTADNLALLTLQRNSDL